MLYYDACGKCGGDMYSRRDIYGSYRECMQCSRIVEITFECLKGKAIPTVDSRVELLWAMAIIKAE